MYNWAGSLGVVMFGSQPKGRGFKSRPVHTTLGSKDQPTNRKSFKLSTIYTNKKARPRNARLVQ